MPNVSYTADTPFARLSNVGGAPFYDPVEPADFPQTVLRYRNQRWAEKVGLGELSDETWTEHFGRFAPLPGNLEQPLAIRYHGHQFRTYNPDLGDGRGFLFAQLRDGAGRLLDFGTKGSGQTPYSRSGDGRLTLKGGVREVLATEMLEALGVYTSKTFSLIETGESLQRGDEPSPTRSAVLVRLGHSHIRFGAFQRLAYEKDQDAINNLVDYCCVQFDADLDGLTRSEKTTRFFERVVARTARLTAQWMAAGFVHGVLNTDNMNVTGESFDYGPWRFLPAVDFGFTAAYFDQTGLYAYGRQPDAAMWNLSRLGGALVDSTDEDALNNALQTFSRAFEAAMVDHVYARLGLTPPRAKAYEFVMALLQWLDASKATFEQFFFDWFCGAMSSDRRENSPNATLYGREDFSPLHETLNALTPVSAERLAHKYFQQSIPCTMLIDEVEAIWAPIADNDDWSAFEEKLSTIAQMREAYDFNASSFVKSPALAEHRSSD